MNIVLLIDGPWKGETVPWMNPMLSTIRLADPVNLEIRPFLEDDLTYTTYKVARINLFGRLFYMGYSCSEAKRDSTAFDYFITDRAKTRLHDIKSEEVVGTARAF